MYWKQLQAANPVLFAEFLEMWQTSEQRLEVQNPTVHWFIEFLDLKRVYVLPVLSGSGMFTCNVNVPLCGGLTMLCADSKTRQSALETAVKMVFSNYQKLTTRAVQKSKRAWWKNDLPNQQESSQEEKQGNEAGG